MGRAKNEQNRENPVFTKQMKLLPPLLFALTAGIPTSTSTQSDTANSLDSQSILNMTGRLDSLIDLENLKTGEVNWMDLPSDEWQRKKIRFSATDDATEEYCPFDGIKFHTDDDVYEDVNCEDRIEIEGKQIGLSSKLDKFNPQHIQYEIIDQDQTESVTTDQEIDEVIFTNSTEIISEEEDSDEIEYETNYQVQN